MAGLGPPGHTFLGLFGQRGRRAARLSNCALWHRIILKFQAGRVQCFMAMLSLVSTYAEVVVVVV